MSPQEIRQLFEDDGHDPRIAEIHIQRTAQGGWYGIATPVGWDQVIIDLDAELNELAPDYQLLQAKQKFGGLRYYISDTNEEAQKAIARASKRASHTCEDCGAEGAELRRLGYWYTTLCIDCLEEEEMLRQGNG